MCFGSKSKSSTPTPAPTTTPDVTAAPADNDQRQRMQAANTISQTGQGSFGSELGATWQESTR